MKKQPKNPVIKPTEGKKIQQKDQQIVVTDANAAKLTVHFLNQIFKRLGYLIKLIEEKK